MSTSGSMNGCASVRSGVVWCSTNTFFAFINYGTCPAPLLQVIVYKDGKEVILPPISNRREVDFGPGGAVAGPAAALAAM